MARNGGGVTDQEREGVSLPHCEGTLVDINALFHQVLVEAVEGGIKEANSALEGDAEKEEEPCNHSWRGCDEDRRRKRMMSDHF